ncbi:MAG: hypothetical protein CMP23_14530 [Rickettsiales bacterium]|nr:hypothetical protein [Rickettsiales bacterium]
MLGSRRPGLVLLLVALLLPLMLSACDDVSRTLNRLDGPVDLALLEPGPFFEVPVAFVSNFRSGRVSKLDLKRSNLLVEDSPAPWASSPDLAFGAQRTLGEIALTVSGDRVDVWVADDSRDELLRGSYITGLDAAGKPLWKRPDFVRSAQWFAADGAPRNGAASLADLRLRAGRATTETWTGTWDGRSLVLQGTASGLQQSRALPGTPYESDWGELAFTLSLAGDELEPGTSVSFEVDSGVESFSAEGLITALLVPEPSSPWVFATVLPDEGVPFVLVMDAQNFTELDRLELPVNASPESLATGHSEGVLWIADSADLEDGSGRAFRLDYVPDDIETLAVTEVPIPEPAIDIAAGLDPAEPRLFVGAAYSDALWSLDPVNYTVIDINPVTPEPDPSYLGTLIAGMDASSADIESAILDEDGTRLRRFAVMVTTFAGSMYWIDAATGCQVFSTPAGAFLEVSPGAVDTTFDDLGYVSNPQLVFDEVSERAVTTHACGGVSRSETWLLRYEEELGSYEVEGSLSGVQQQRAYEGERYISDGGELSVLILPGTRPTTDGDRWTFPINDGVGPVALHELPGDPLVFTELFDNRDGPWWKVREREVALVPHAGNDVVLWLDIQAQSSGTPRIYR